MRFLPSAAALATCVAVASGFEHQGSTTTLEILNEPRSAGVNGPSLELRDVSIDTHEPIEKETAVANSLCLYSVEEIRDDVAGSFSPYSVEELIAAKEELEKSGDCSPFRDSLNKSLEETPSRKPPVPQLGRNIHQNVPKCVNAILPGHEGAETSPDGTDDSSAIRRRLSTAALIIAIAALIAA